MKLVVRGYRLSLLSNHKVQVLEVARHSQARDTLSIRLLFRQCLGGWRSETTEPVVTSPSGQLAVCELPLYPLRCAKLIQAAAAWSIHANIDEIAGAYRETRFPSISSRFRPSTVRSRRNRAPCRKNRIAVRRSTSSCLRPAES